LGPGPIVCQAPLFVGPMFVLLFADDAFIMDNKEKKEMK
jgi:hypothetical protein